MTPQLLLQMAVRNLGAHKVKSLIVGSILFVGTLFIVVGGALLDSVNAGMEKSITQSVAGNLQVYSDKATDPLALFGGMSFGATDIGEIEDFESAVGPLRELENVKTVVPMGIVNSTVFGKNDIDLVLDGLRTAVATGDEAQKAVLVGRLRRIVDTLAEEIATREAIVADKEKLARDQEALREAGSQAFWDGFAADPLPALDFLDAKIAPLASDARLLYLRLVGTDLELFKQTFDRFTIIDGEAVPPGEPGILLSKRTYEKLVKNKVARDFDKIYKEWTEDGKRIADDKATADAVSRMARQYQRIVVQVSPDQVPALLSELQSALGSKETDLGTLVQTLLTVDDDTIESRYALFYKAIAPRVRLYDFPVGSEITLRAFTTSGYMRSFNVKIWGTYEFKGLEKSDLSTAMNLVDLPTFRSLYGKMTAAQQAELKDIKTQIGVEDVDRGSAEDALFGSGSIEAAAPVEGAPVVEVAPITAASAEAPAEVATLVLNAAVVLRDPSRTAETQAQIQALSKEKSLGLQVIDWKAASGLLGQFATVVQGILVTVLLIIFLVALVIINNTTSMATMDRINEIGTMRAIGTTRGQILVLFLTETAMLGLIAGGLGAITGGLLVAWMGVVGIPAGADILVFLFAGPRLHPTVGLDNLALGVISVLCVALISAAYPAILASRVQPVVAMQGKE